MQTGFRQPGFKKRCSSAIGALGLSVLICAGCGGTQKSTALSYGQNAEAAYKGALEEYNDDNCVSAEPVFREVSKKYPYSRFAALAELRTADCLVKQGTFASGVAAYQDFVRRRPSHKKVPYAHFKIAEAYYKQMPGEWLLSPPAHEKDLAQTTRARESLQGFIDRYPKDGRSKIAKKMLYDSSSMLAAHEMYVAEFYLDRDKPKAAIGRLEGLLKDYPSSRSAKKAKAMLKELYVQNGAKAKALP